MKLLLDFLPVFLFFIVVKLGDRNKEWAAAWLTHNLGFMVAGGVVGLKEAPTLLATVAMVVVAVLQIVVMKLLRKKIDKMLWFSLAVALVLGGLTVYFHDQDYIMWKPTVIYWVMAAGLLISDIIMRRYALRTMMNAADFELPENIWRNLSWAWVLFFVSMGALNRYVAVNYEDYWPDFKLWGGIGLMLVFTFAQSMYLVRHMPPAKPKDDKADAGVSQ